MRVVYSIRIRKELREEMEKYRGEVDWNREIEGFIEERLRELKKKHVLKEIDELLKGMEEVEAGFHDKLLREDRDSGH